MEKRLFTASVEWNRKVWLEFMGSVGTRGRRWSYFVLIALATWCILWCFWIVPAKTRLIVCIVCLIMMTVAEILSWRRYHKMLDQSDGMPVRNQFSVREEEIRRRNPFSGNESTIAYDRITSAHRSKNLLVLGCADQTWCCIDLRTVNGGTADEMMDFIMARCGGLKKKVIPRRRNKKVPMLVYTAVLVIGLLCSFPGGMSESDFGSDLSLTPQEAAVVLQELGITGISQELVWELEADLEGYGLNLPSYNAVPDLLYYAGAGEYDPEDWSWTPARNGVYTFDMEVWDVAVMYTDFLAGISAMSQEELVFSDVVEDDSLVNMEDGTGVKRISFTFRGQRITLEAEMMYDWMDLSFLNRVADLVNDSGGEKKLYYLFSDSQMISAFYCTDEWADHFHVKTGYTLTKTIPTY